MTAEPISRKVDETRAVMSDGFSFPLFDAATGTLMLPWWAAAALAALFVVVVVLAMLRGGPVLVVGGLVGIAFLLIVVAVVWVGSERVTAREHAEERRALLARAQELATQAAAPGSALACLDAAAGETVETACERVLFASAEAVAGAIAYTAARVALLSDGVDYSVRANASYEGALPGLRRALEIDRYGFVAQVLTSHYGCSADHCDAFTLFRDTDHIAANLKDRSFDSHVSRHAASWRPGRSPATASSSSPVPPGFNVPSAASIPPVSIMVPEPPASAAPPSNPAPPAQASAPAQPRRPAPAPRRPATASPAPPVQLVPPAPTAPPTPAGNTGTAPRAQ
jgi:hypothetical protein